MDEQLMGFLERGVSALEALAQDPMIEIEAGPPICPHCQKINPDVEVKEDDARVPMFEFVLVARCHACGNKFYAIPLTWHTHASLEDAKLEMESRVEVINAH